MEEFIHGRIMYGRIHTWCLANSYMEELLFPILLYMHIQHKHNVLIHTKSIGYAFIYNDYFHLVYFVTSLVHLRGSME